MTHNGRARFPEFYIVGAPRCATTFMHRSLIVHPDVFMPKLKEPHFFSNDLDRGMAADRDYFIRSEADYLALFDDARPDQVRGEADVLNLFSPGAAARIRRARPDARIVIQLRDPVEHMRSYHGVRYRVGSEGLTFAAALEAAPARARRKRLPWKARNLPMYDYRAVSRFAEQVERYLDTFPREQLLILLLDDIVADYGAAYDRVLEHIGVGAGFRPEFEVINASHRVRSRAALSFIRWPLLINSTQRVVPRRFWPAARSLVLRTSDVIAPPGDEGWKDPELRARLRTEYAPEVARLGELLGRDLVSLWGYDRT